MSTRIVSRNDLIGINSLTFIRPQRINFSISNVKPLTRLYAFFDGVSVDQYLNAIITSDASGAATGYFDLPPSTFNTGSKAFVVQDNSSFDGTNVPGSTVGFARATFTALGVKQTWQETVTNVTTIRLYDDGSSAGSDPLAQSFFTYGVTGGCYITSIDLYFSTKDTTLPVSIELREMVNGYPGPRIVSKYAKVVKNPSSILTSSNSSLATNFAFSRPIYLQEDKEYCFVVLANTNQYNLFTSKLSEASIETGKTIFDQPFIGSLFKSENNTTWTAEQTEDIKFTLNKANFTVGASDVTFKALAPQTLIYGADFSVTSGSAVVSLKTRFQHGFVTGDKIYLTGNSTGLYRGITNANITSIGGYTVTRIDDNNLTFTCGANATSTGTLDSSGIVNAILIDAVGSGYTNGTYALTIAAPPSGTTATANLVISGGKFTSVTITNAGSGYVSTPTFTLPGGIGSGTGGILTIISENIFGTVINRKYQLAAPTLSTQTPTQTLITNTLRSSSDSYVVGTHTLQPVNKNTNIGKQGVLVSAQVESASFGSTDSTQMITRLETTNSNVSPMIDLGENPRLRAFNTIINSETAVAGSETSPTVGYALARYVSKQFTLGTPSKGARVIVNAASTSDTGFDVYFRTSISGSGTTHTTLTWTKMNCLVTRNLSNTIMDFLDYEFYLDGLTAFDVYDIKLVLYSNYKNIYPTIAHYRSVILAT